MSRSILRIIGVFVISICAFLLSVGNARATVRVMPLGDSITHGMGAGAAEIPGGYREPLAHAYVDGGASFVFVGSVSANSTTYLTATSQQNHEGHTGWRIDQIQSSINSWQAIANPDVILLHIGTNDISQNFDLGTGVGNDTSSAISRLETLISTLYSNNESLKVVLSTLIPIQDARDDYVKNFNAALVSTVIPNFTGQGRDIVLVDNYANFVNPDTSWKTELFADYAHPNADGYAAMAATFAAVPLPSLPGIVFTPQSSAGSGGEDSAIVTNLIQAGQSTLGGVTAPTGSLSGSFPVSGLNDGTATSTYYSVTDTSGGATALPVTLTFDLDTTVNTFGYDISSIQAISGWGDHSLGAQRFQLLLSVNHGVYADYGTYTNASVVNGGNSSYLTTLTDTSGLIAANVTGIRFVFLNPDPVNGAGVVGDSQGVSDGGTVIHELQAFGTASATAPPPVNFATSEVNEDPTHYDAAVDTSLITSGQSSLSYMTGTTPTLFSLGGVNDGVGNVGDNNTLTFYNGLGSAGLTFHLTQGYDITSIAALCGWTDSYFGSHSFSVLLETGSSGIYTSIGSFGQRAYTGTPPAGYPAVTDSGFSILTTISNTSGIIASNVTGIRFVFTDPYPDIPSISGTVIRELSVVGTATDPVPASAPVIGGPIIPAVGEPLGAGTRTDSYGAAGYGFYTPVEGTTVNRIGYWDQGGDGLVVSHDVMIVGYNGSNWSEVVRVTIPAGTAARLEGGFRWVSIPDLILPNIGQGADYYGIVASQGTDPWSNGLGSGVPMTPMFGTKQNGGLVNGGGPMVAGDVTFIGGNPGWGGANFGYEPPTTVPALADDRVKVMPLGDSITAGYTDNPTWNEAFEYGYRGPLATAFLDSGLPFKFVGLSAEPFNNVSGDPTHNATVFPANELRDPAINQGAHRGYGGWSIAQINSNVAAWIATDDPDVILLHIGTNGIGAGSPGELNTLVGNIFATKPVVKLVVAQIMPAISYNADVIAYNDYIRDTLVPAYQTAGRDISTVDQYANFLTDPEDDTSIDAAKFSNGINHPTNVAYGLMANTWLPAITPITLSSSSIPATTTAGSTLATLTRLGAADGETLTYSLVSGTDSSDNDSFMIVGDQLKAGGHAFGADPAGASYRIRVQVVGSVTGTATQTFRLTRAVGAANPLPISIATVNDGSQTAYEADVKNDDLLQGVAGTFTYLQTAGGAVGQKANDGLHGGAQEFGALAWAADGNISSLTYEIGVGSGFGYDVSTITTIAAWGDSGFMNQKYKVSVRYSGATEYVPAPECTVDYQPVTNTGVVAGATKVTITRPGGMVFSRIEGIRFTCLNVANTTVGGSTTFREIDVEGAASAALTPFESFMADYPEITGNDSDPDADPDMDGLTNLQEFGFDTHPGVPSFGPIAYAAGVVTGHGRPLVVGSHPNYDAVFGRRQDYLAAGLTYTVQFSAGLDFWVASTDIPTVLASSATMDAVSVPFPASITTPNGIETPTFFRVGVSSN